jgi:hypothetical protein
VTPEYAAHQKPRALARGVVTDLLIFDLLAHLCYTDQVTIFNDTTF